MSDFEDQPLVRASEPVTPIESPAARADSRLYIAVAAAALVLGALGAWWWSGRREAAPAGAAAVAATEGSVASTANAARPLPPLSQMDTFIRALLGALSSHPQLARWLATDDLVSQMADAIDKISRGQTPAKTVPVLKPQDIFEIRGARGQLVIDPRSYRRYDAFAAAVASLNANGLAQAYRTIQPRLDEAYRSLGRSENSVDEAVGVALNMLLATPDVQDPIRLIHGKGATYAFADPKLEALTPVQKHLIRMGPQNAAIIRARLRELAAALNASPKPIT